MADTRWLAWGGAPLIQLVFVRGAWAAPDAIQIGVETALWVAMAVIQRRFAPKGSIWASAAWPAVLLVAMIALRVLDPLFWGVPVVIAAVLFIRVLDDVLAKLPMLDVPLVLLAGFVARYLALVQAPVLMPQVEILAPFQLPSPTATSELRPVVWISVDTLRADASMPAHEHIASKGQAWDAAMSTSSWTVPALGSMHTGLWPRDHGAVRGNTGFGALQVSTVAQELSDVGYTTAAFVANPFASSSLGFARGFGTWLHPDENAPHLFALTGRPAGPGPRDAARVVEHALDWLDEQPDTGWFLWVHLMDPHLPYDHALPDHVQAHDDDLPRAFREGRVEVSEPEREALRAAYAVEVAHADLHVRRLVDELERRRVFETGLVVSTSDHGEEFWEHGGFEHGHAHVPQVVDVKLAIAGAGIPHADRQDLASLADVAATTRAFAELPVFSGDNVGFDLREPIPEARIALTEGNLYGEDISSARRGPDRWQTGEAMPAHVQQLVEHEGVDLVGGSVNEDALRELGYME
ncbi:MAG: sulfatase [Proteobacteria bacterium]|nr:sulfatase [Pseudomonadota bacterium]MCP4917699.1 sulfatase [Pseudomonadota bacterium]